MLNGLSVHKTTSASFPVFILPTLSATCNAFAGFKVTILSASSSLTPPYLTAFAAS